MRTVSHHIWFLVQRQNSAPWCLRSWIMAKQKLSIGSTMLTLPSSICLYAYSRPLSSTTSAWEKTWACEKLSYYSTTSTQSSRCPSKLGPPIFVSFRVFTLFMIVSFNLFLKVNKSEVYAMFNAVVGDSVYIALCIPEYENSYLVCRFRRQMHSGHSMQYISNAE